MSKTNYSKQAAIMPDTETKEVFDDTKKEPIPAPIKENRGTVYNCSKLNIRMQPNKTAPVLCVLNAGDQVKINGKTNDGWVRVHTDSGLRAYAMAEYIKEN